MILKKFHLPRKLAGLLKNSAMNVFAILINAIPGFISVRIAIYVNQ
jgi:hypothetical protein